MSDGQTNLNWDQSKHDVLRDLTVYPKETIHVELVETHISLVAITDDYVYKFKKPVDLDFLDYSTIEKRKHFAELEVSLNSRLSEGVYLGICKLVELEGAYQILLPNEDLPDQSTLVDYAVFMQKLDETKSLENMLIRGEVEKSHIEQIVDRLSRFYKHQHFIPADQQEKFHASRNMVLNNFHYILENESIVSQSAALLLQQHIEIYFQANERIILNRVPQNHFVDGHGDLRPEHILIDGETVNIIDCVEFQDNLREIDIASDVAFLYMELVYRNHQELATFFIIRMKEALQDEGLEQFLPVYTAYRALVRCKVSLIKMNQVVDAGEKNQLAHAAQRYFSLALQSVITGCKLTIFVFMGTIASGKSTQARMFASFLSAEQFSSDTIRKELACMSVDARSDETDRKEIYKREMTIQTYGELYERSKHASKSSGISVVDATFSDVQQRKLFIEKCQNDGIRYQFVYLHADENTIRQRLSARNSENASGSDARLENMDQLLNNFSAPDEISPDHIIKIKSQDESVESTQLEILKLILDRNEYVLQ